ncbi:MAG: hypothetical protein KBA91_01600 [Candidatus Moranbacteria bacterium]|nr:hypothetical protein [Candidatus Moranbacteria bacterium]
MAFLKIVTDSIAKALLDGKGSVPRELLELNQYFRRNDPINFEFKKEGGLIIGVSTNFRFGSIVSTGKNPAELDKNIKDAILTAFDVPSSYAKEANVINVGANVAEKKSYALA